MTRSLLVMAKFHRILSFTLSCSPQVAAEPEHAVQTTVSINCEFVNSRLSVIDDSISFIQQSDNITLELSWGGNDRLHERFQNLRLAFHERFSERLLSRVLK